MVKGKRRLTCQVARIGEERDPSSLGRGDTIGVGHGEIGLKGARDVAVCQ